MPITELQQKKLDIETKIEENKKLLKKIEFDIKNEKILDFVGDTLECFLNNKQQQRIFWIKYHEGDLIGFQLSTEGISKFSPDRYGVEELQSERHKKITKEEFMVAANKYSTPFIINLA